MYDDRVRLLSERIDLLQKQDSILKEKETLLKKNVTNKKSNKNSDSYPFSSYEKCFIARALRFTSLLFPTAMIRLECDGKIFGPFRALLDSGSQPTLISHTLYKQMRCTTSQTARRLVGIASMPAMIKRKVDMTIRPWFDSSVSVEDTIWVLPHTNQWKPWLPSKTLNVQLKDHEFHQTLADPEYYIPKEVHILLGIETVVRMLDYKIGNEEEA